MIPQNVFAERIRLLRTKQNLSQQQLGDIIGLSKQAINDIEHGRHMTPLNKAVALAKHFAVSSDYLLGLSDNPERS